MDVEDGEGGMKKNVIRRWVDFSLAYGENNEFRTVCILRSARGGVRFVSMASRARTII